jgi:hypothetical protein
MLREKAPGVKREPSARAGFTYNIGASTATAEGFDEEREWTRGFSSAHERHFTKVDVNFR